MKSKLEKRYNNAMRKYLIISASLFILLAALIFYYAYHTGPQVLVRSDPQLKETVYTILGEDRQKISFVTCQTELNDKVLRFRSASTLPLKKQLRLAAILLDRIIKDRPLTSFNTLSVGRLVMAFGSDDTLSRRLTTAARTTSPIPFARINNTVRDLANQQMIYPELVELFARYGITIKVAAVEKVLVNEASVPYDCQTWFSLAK